MVGAAILALLAGTLPLLVKIQTLAREKAEARVGMTAFTVAARTEHQVILIANRAMDLSRNVDFAGAVQSKAAAQTKIDYLKALKKGDPEVRAELLTDANSGELLAAWPAKAATVTLPAAITKLSDIVKDRDHNRGSYTLSLQRSGDYLARLNLALSDGSSRPRPAQQSASFLLMLLPVGGTVHQAAAVLWLVLPIEELLPLQKDWLNTSGQWRLTRGNEPLAPFVDFNSPADWIRKTAPVVLTHNIGGGKVLLTAEVIEPAAPYLGDVRQTVLEALWPSLLSLLAVIAVAMVAARAILAPLTRLSDVAEAYGRGDLRPAMELSAFKEWNVFQLTLQRLGQRIEDQLAQAAQAERSRGELARAKVESDLKALQEQVKPHFIFNVLNNIRTLISVEPDRAVQMLETFSELYRLIVAATKTVTISLEQELDVVSRYLALQGMRFEERLNFYGNVPEPLRKLQVPSLILQTLVENAIKHGLAKARGGGSIWLDVTMEEGLLTITLKNTGAPLMQPVVYGTGLDNMTRRLALMYEVGHGPHLSTDADGKTVVSLTLRERTP